MTVVRARPGGPAGRVLYVWDGTYPWDVRTEKICRTLSEQGMDVMILARNAGDQPRETQLPEGLVVRTRLWSWVGRKLDRLTTFPAFINPRWFAHIASGIRRHRPDVVIVRDLPLAPTALWVSRAFGVPVVFDMAEHYAAMIEGVWRTGRQGPFDALVRNPRAIAAVERYVLPRMDHTITVVEESSARVAALGIPPDRLTVVSNTPPALRASSAPVTKSPSDRLVLTYLGLMEAPRGILEVLDALAVLHRAGHPVELRLIGGGRDLGLFQGHAATLGLTEPTVRFLGQVPNREALQEVAKADVGLVPHHADDSWNNTIPNKLFDYMAAGLPVVTSSAIPAARIVREAGCGVVYRSQDAEDMARQVLRLFDPEVRAKMSAAGRQAIVDRHNWEADSARLIDVIRRTSSAARK